MTVKSSISLTDQQAEFARRLVEEGRYSTLSSVIQHGLELMRQQDEAREAELELMRTFFERRGQGPFLAQDEFDRRVDAMLAQKRRAHALDD